MSARDDYAKLAVDLRVREEQAALRLMAVLSAASIAHAQAEVKRREVMFREMWETTSRGRPHVTALTAAYESVAHDVTLGYLS